MTELLVLVHGFHRHASDMAPLAAYLERAFPQRFTIVVPELPATYQRVSTCIDELQKAIADHVQVANTIHLVGHSMGGSIVTQWLAKQPASVHTKVRTLVCIGTPWEGSLQADLLCLLGVQHWQRALNDLRTDATWPITLTNVPWPPQVLFMAGNHNAMFWGKLLMNTTPCDGRVAVASALSSKIIPAHAKQVVVAFDHHHIHKKDAALQIIANQLQ